MGVHPDTDDQSKALIKEDTRTSADVAHNGPERLGGSFHVKAKLPAPEPAPQGRGPGRLVHSRVGEYGEFHPENVYDDVARDAADDRRANFDQSRMEAAMDSGYDPHERY